MQPGLRDGRTTLNTTNTVKQKKHFTNTAGLPLLLTENATGEKYKVTPSYFPFVHLTPARFPFAQCALTWGVEAFKAELRDGKFSETPQLL